MNYLGVSHRIPSSKLLQRLSALHIVSSWLSTSTTLPLRLATTKGVVPSYDRWDSTLPIITYRSVHTERMNNRSNHVNNNDPSVPSSHANPLTLTKALEETEYVLRIIQEIQEQFEKVHNVFATEYKLPNIEKLHEHYRTALQGLFHHGLMYECLMLIEKYQQFWNFYTVTIAEDTSSSSEGTTELPFLLQQEQRTIKIQANAWLNKQLMVPSHDSIGHTSNIHDNTLTHSEIISVLHGYILHQRWSDLYQFTGLQQQLLSSSSFVPEDTRIMNIPNEPSNYTGSTEVSTQRNLAIEYVLEAWLDIARKYLTNYALSGSSSSSRSANVVTGSTFTKQLISTKDGINILYNCINYYYTYILNDRSNKSSTIISHMGYRYIPLLLRFLLDNLSYAGSTDENSKVILTNLWKIVTNQQQLLVDGLRTLLIQLSGTKTSTDQLRSSILKDTGSIVYDLPWSPSVYGSFLRTALHFNNINIVQQLIYQLDSSLFQLWKYSTFSADIIDHRGNLSIRNENDIYRIFQETLPKLSVHKDISKLYGFLLRILSYNNNNKSVSSPMELYTVRSYLTVPMVRQTLRLLLENQLYSDTLSLVQLLIRQFMINHPVNGTQNITAKTYDAYCNDLVNYEKATATFADTVESSSLFTQSLVWSVKPFSNPIYVPNELSSARIGGMFSSCLNTLNDTLLSSSEFVTHPLQDPTIFRAVIVSLYHRQQHSDLFQILGMYDKVWKICMLDDMDYYLGNSTKTIGSNIINLVLEIAIHSNDTAFLSTTLIHILKNYSPKFTANSNKYVQQAKGAPEFVRLLCMGFDKIVANIPDKGLRIQLFEQLVNIYPPFMPVSSESNKILIKQLIPVYREKIFLSSHPSLVPIYSIIQKLTHQKIKVSPKDGMNIVASLMEDNSFPTPVLFPFQFLHQLVLYGIIENIHTNIPHDGSQIIYSLSAGLSNYAYELSEREIMVIRHILRFIYSAESFIDRLSPDDFRILYVMINKRYDACVSNTKGSKDIFELRNLVNASLTLLMYGNMKENQVWTRQDFTDVYHKASFVLSLLHNKWDSRLPSPFIYLGRTLRVLLDKYNQGLKIPFPLSVSSSSLEDIVASLVSENEGWTLSRILSHVSVPGAPTTIPEKSSKGFSLINNSLTVPTAIHSRFVQSFEKNLGFLHLSASSGTSSSINDIYRFVLQNLDENIYFDKQYGKHLSTNKPPTTMTGTKATIGGSSVPWTSLLQGTPEQRNRNPQAYLMFNEICSTTDQQRVSVTEYPTDILNMFPWSSNVDMNDFQVWNSIVSSGGGFGIPDDKEVSSTPGGSDRTKFFSEETVVADSALLQKVSLQQLTSVLGHCLTEAKPLFPILAMQLFRHGAFIVPAVADQLALLTNDYPSLTIPLLSHLRLQFVTVIGNLPWSLMAQTKISLSGSGFSSFGLNEILESLVKARQLQLALELLDEVAPIVRQQMAPNKPSTLKMVPVSWWAPDVHILQQVQTLAEDLQEKQVGKMVSVLMRNMVRTVPQEHPHERKPVGLHSTA